MDAISRRQNPAGKLCCWNAIVFLFILSACAVAEESREFGRFGLALKTGEAAGAMGIQVAWNFTRHAQICGGVGGVADLDPFLSGNRGRTDSYFLLAKGYRDHLYVATGYSLKNSRIEKAVTGSLYTATRPEHGIPFHIGYEFGHRSGFFYATSIGYLYVFGGGHRDVAAGSAIISSTSRTAKSGPSLGMSIGYYLW